MFSLMRKKVIDRLLGPSDLDGMTDLWLAWHEDALMRQRRQLQGYHAVALRLYGFPRQRGEVLKEELQRRLQERRWDYPIHLSDPDFLGVSSPFRSCSESCSLGEWLALVQTPAFCGLVAFLRLGLHDWPGLPEGPAYAGSTLVLCGRLETDGFLLKALWPGYLERGLEPLFEKAVWSDEERVLQACEQYQRNRVVLPGPADLFASRLAQKMGTFVTALMHYLHDGRGRLPWFLTRTAFHSSALVLIGILYFLLPPFQGKRVVFAWLAILFGVLLGRVLSGEALRVQRLHKNISAGLKKRYSQTLSIETVDLAELGVKDDPNVVKYSVELEALGCRHLADFRLLPALSGTWYHRFFVLPGDSTYVSLNLMFAAARDLQKFPAHTAFHVITYFEDLQIVSINEGGGFRKPIVPTVLARVFPGVHDPALLLAAHRKRVEQLRREGHVLVSLMNAPALFERMAQDHVETAAANQKHGYYSWSAAVRQNFGLVRRELMGKIEDK